MYVCKLNLRVVWVNRRVIRGTKEMRYKGTAL